MYSDIVLKVDAVSKHYDVFSTQREKLSKLMRDALNLEPSLEGKKFKALKNISFEIKKGEIVGVLGRNGAGKSTLLQLICGTLTPTSGKITINGRLAALLELGAGFNPEFTGRENVYINSAILGLSKSEVKEKFDSIVKFADIGDFIEHPVKNYSSGMFMRLAFAVASSVEPDILIIDEALAVGDARFQSKCFRRLDELRDNGTTILLVTHSTEQITRHCSKALLIDHGEMLAFGDSGVVSNQYLELLFGQNVPVPDVGNLEYKTKKLKKLEESKFYNVHEHRWGNGEAEIVGFNICQGNEFDPTVLISDLIYEIKFSVKFNTVESNIILGLTLKTSDGITVFGRNTQKEANASVLHSVVPGQVVTAIFFIKPQLCTGDYLISLGVVKESLNEIIPMERRYDSICVRVESSTYSYGLVDLNHKIEVVDGRV